MDALAGFLDGPRAQGAFVLRSILDPPWALRVQDEAPLTLVALVAGAAWITFDGGAPHRLLAGDVAVILGPVPYTVSDDPETPVDIVIHPGQHCATPSGEPLAETMDLGVRTWGNSRGGVDVLLTGTYQTDGEVSRRLLTALPPLTVLRGTSWDCPIIGLLADEVGKEEPGQQAVLDRLLDLLLVAALRASFAGSGDEIPAWYRAHGDPIVGPTLRMIHNDPAHPWSVASLAAGARVSRAAYARRFHELVGEPPISYLTTWRMAVAADLLLEPDATVGNVAARVGYGSPFTFSTAFKRAHGQSPRSFRDDRRVLDRQNAGAR